MSLVLLFLRNRRVSTASARSAGGARPDKSAVASQAVPRIVYDEGEDEPLTNVGPVSTPVLGSTIFADPGAMVDEPTGMNELVFLSAAAQSDKGKRRKRNEDRVLAMEKEGIFAIADGMGGVRGGDVASTLAVDTLRKAFEAEKFDPIPDDLPRRAKELASAIRSANDVVYSHASDHEELRGMGTTMTAARFSRRKKRLYVGHVGDSRVYRVRGGSIQCLTTDHTMSTLGVTGEEAGNLSRSLGVWPRVPIDMIMAIPEPDDVYLLCSDGLNKMIDEDSIAKMLEAGSSLDEVAQSLVSAANDAGGKDNVSVVVVRVEAAQTPVAA